MQEVAADLGVTGNSLREWVRRAEVEAGSRAALTQEEAGKYWDTHDLGDIWEQTEEVAFDVDIRGSATYFPVESTLSKELRKLVSKHGVSAETLLNLWERLRQE